MKKLIIITMIFFTGCWISKPNLKADYEGLSAIEINMQYKFDRCCYMQQYVKNDLRCTDLLLENRKIQNILDYNTLKKNNALPELFNQKGSYEMNFDAYYRYIK